MYFTKFFFVREEIDNRTEVQKANNLYLSIQIELHTFSKFKFKSLLLLQNVSLNIVTLQPKYL